ncbi:MAG: polysaccharide deacetylase family protein [Clostridia bacterium]|nr:polysaccharide deacetylase family protein [Clostridia bacterium]
MVKRILSAILGFAITFSVHLFLLPSQSFANSAETDTKVTTAPATPAAAPEQPAPTIKYIDVNANQWFYPYILKIKGLQHLAQDTPLLKPYEFTTLEEIFTLLQAQDNDLRSIEEALAKSKTSKLLDENADLHKTATREDLYTAVGRYYGIETVNKLFEDTANVYANGFLEKNIITPLAQNNKFVFSPTRPVSRAEAIVLIEKAKLFKTDAKSFSAITQKPVYLPILIYHEITEDKEKLSKSGSLFVSPSKFTQDVQTFQKNGYSAVTFEEVKAFMDGYVSIPEKPYVITFDDGYKGNHTYAFTIAKENKVKFVVNLVAETIQRPATFSDAYAKNQHLSDKDIWEMHSSGLVEFQSHTYNLHRSFGETSLGNGVGPFRNEPQLSYSSRLGDDLQRSAGVIRYLTGYTPCVLTYPMGIYNTLADELCVRNGFTFTLTTEEGVNNLQNGTTKLKRINVSNWSVSDALVNAAGKR